MRVSKLVFHVWVLLTAKELDKTTRNFVTSTFEANHRGSCDGYERLSSIDMSEMKSILKSGI